MAAKKILMTCGDYCEDYETMVPFRALLAVGHTVHAVCPVAVVRSICVRTPRWWPWSNRLPCALRAFAWSGDQHTTGEPVLECADRHCQPQCPARAGHRA